MTKLPFFQVDAFADRPFAGNPAAVMPLDAWLPDELLQAIAAENNLSETAFLVPSDQAGIDRELRWFTPTTEIGLCGHATLASGHVLLSADPRRDGVRFLTRRSGELEVTRAGESYALSLPALAPEPRSLDAIVAALGIERALETAWHANGYAIVLLEDEAAVRAVAPDFQRLRDGSDTLAIVTAPGDTTDIVSRVFAPNHGIDEDPVTGGAHATLVPYWAERLGRDTFTAFQASARGGRLDCRLDGGRSVLGGRCVTVIEGAFAI
jgi:PhzF family phenazine biosynthesis protein